MAGILSVVLGQSAFALFGGGPPSDPTGAELLAWAGDQQGTFDGFLVLLAGQFFAFAIFVAGLYWVLRADHTAAEGWPILGLIGGIVAGTVLAMQYVAVAPFAIHLTELSEPTALVLRDVALALNSPLAVAGALAMLGYGVAIRRTGELPAWLGYLAYLGAAVAAVGGLAVVSTAQGTGFGIVTAIGAFVFLLWTLLVGIWMLRPARRTSVSDR